MHALQVPAHAITAGVDEGAIIAVAGVAVTVVPATAIDMGVVLLLINSALASDAFCNDASTCTWKSTVIHCTGAATTWMALAAIVVVV